MLRMTVNCKYLSQERIEKKAKVSKKLLRNSFPDDKTVNEVVSTIITSDFMSVIRCKLPVVNRVLEYSRTHCVRN